MPYWIRPTTRQAILARSARVAAQEGRTTCVYGSMSQCGGGMTIEHVIPRAHWDSLLAAAPASPVAARRLATLVERFGGKNHRLNLVGACLHHNSARRDLKLAEYATEACVRYITSERRAPLAA